MYLCFSFFHRAGIELGYDHIESIEETESRNSLELETVIGEEVHERQEAKICRERETAAWATGDDRTDDTTDEPKSCLTIEILVLSELESTIKYREEEERESKDHDDREGDIQVGVYWSIVPEHDGDICERPPCWEREKDEDEIDHLPLVRCEEFFKIREHKGFRV